MNAWMIKGRHFVWPLLLLLSAALGAPLADASVRSEVLYARGLVPFNNGYWEQAYRLFNEAVKADPRDAQALYYRGLTQARRGSQRAAVADLERALQLDPSLAQASLDLGIAYLDQGDNANARLWLERAYRQGADRLTAALFLGIALYRSNDLHGALRYFEEAKADPQARQAALYYGGLALIGLEQTQQGRNALAEAARERPDSEMGRAASRYVAGDTIAPVAELAAPAQRRFSIGTLARLEYDSNVVLGSDDAIGDTEADPDARAVIGVGGRVLLLESDWGDLAARASLSQSIHFSQREFDLTAARARIEWAAKPSWWGYGATAGYDFHALEYETFYQDFVVSPWLALYEHERTATQLYYGFRYRDFFREPFDPFRDGINNAGGVRQYVLLPDDVTILHGGYQLDYESPEDTGDSDIFLAAGAEDFEYLGHQIDLQLDSAVDLPAVGVFSGSLGYRFRYDDYSNDNSRSREQDPSDPEPRRDLEHLFALIIARDLNENIAFLRDVTQRTELTLSLIADINTSNLDVFAYDRVIAGFGIRAEF
ncbi:MAG TPA: tetratricopeptide repeat protein [Terriglobales bacterium]|nr:tetratricopeptide repeat protein [Terriglobales bacterium]